MNYVELSKAFNRLCQNRDIIKIKNNLQEIINMKYSNLECIVDFNLDKKFNYIVNYETINDILEFSIKTKFGNITFYDFDCKNIDSNILHDNNTIYDFLINTIYFNIHECWDNLCKDLFSKIEENIISYFCP